MRRSILLGLIWLWPILASSDNTAELAYQAFQQQDYQRAQGYYDQLNDYSGWFGLGASAYRQQDLEMTVFAFREAAVKALTDEQRASALYNLGNGYFLANLWPEAIESYRQALLYQAGHQKAQHNLALALIRQQKAQKVASQAESNQEKGEDSNNSKQDEGAFYGGQKPSEEGEVSGQDAEGIAGAKDFVLPEAAMTDFSESTLLPIEQIQASGQAILQQAQRQKQLAAFEMKMRQVEDNQAALLKRIFEREAGFQAEQAEPHILPGVAPW